MCSRARVYFGMYSFLFFSSFFRMRTFDTHKLWALFSDSRLHEENFVEPFIYSPILFLLTCRTSEALEPLNRWFFFSLRKWLVESILTSFFTLRMLFFWSIQFGLSEDMNAHSVSRCQCLNRWKQPAWMAATTWQRFFSVQNMTWKPLTGFFFSFFPSPHNKLVEKNRRKKKKRFEIKTTNFLSFFFSRFYLIIFLWIK